jgi:hypothetical protein
MPEEIQLHSRIALKDGLEGYYPRAMPLAEGWARAVKTDEDGFLMVNIEWDKSHWRYNGQRDGWTFADHFKTIGAPAEPEESYAVNDEELPQDPEPIGPTDDEIEEYIATLTDAMEAASESEGFFVIGIRRQPNPGNPNETVYMPSVYMQALTPEARTLLQVQLMEIASSNYQQLMVTLMNKVTRIEEVDEDDERGN